MANQIHVMYDKDSKTWYTKQDGASRASSTGHKTQAEAENRANEIARNQKLERSTHRKDNNNIRSKDSYGNDPKNIKG